jgi:hypothetical protein
VTSYNSRNNEAGILIILFMAAPYRACIRSAHVSVEIITSPPLKRFIVSENSL